jgi:peptide/nickel transport system permease protein
MGYTHLLIHELLMPDPVALIIELDLSQLNWIQRLIRNRSANIGLVIILIYIGMAFAGLAALTPYPANEQHPKAAERLQPPSMHYLMGSDQFGRDIFSRIISGSTYSLRVAVVSVALAAFFGTLIGLLAGYYGGLPDTIIMRVMDIFFAFPALLLALSIVAALGPGPNNVIPAIALVYTPIFARVARAPVLAVKNMEFITAARSIGMRHRRIIFRHVLPNSLGPVSVTISLALSWALVTEAGLSFLGLGPQPPDSSWGLMLQEGRNLSEIAPWLVIFPGLAIVFGVLGFNLLGDGLREVLDPRLRH